MSGLERIPVSRDYLYRNRVDLGPQIMLSRRDFSTNPAKLDTFWTRQTVNYSFKGLFK